MSNEVLLQKAFPVIEGIPDQLFAELEDRNYKDFIPVEKKLFYITTCEKVRRDYLEEFQHEMYKGLEQFGYPYKELKQKDQNNSKIDRWIGKFLYEKMEISPSVAATLGMWQFMNLYMFPSVVYWRWGNAKHRYISSMRNYCGTMWWRHYFFTQSPELEKVFMFLTEDEIVSLYERPRTRGLPDHIRNNVIWYRELCKKYGVNNKDFYRDVIKNYNAELGFRNYYALNMNDLYQIYEEVFVSCLGVNSQKIQDEERFERHVIAEQNKIDDKNIEKKNVNNMANSVIKEKTEESSFSSDNLEYNDFKFLSFKKDVKNIDEVNKKALQQDRANNSIIQNKGEVVSKKILVVGKNNKVESLTREIQTSNGVIREVLNTGKGNVSSNYIFSNSTVLIIRNPIRNGIEITFESFPKEIIKTEIKRIGFRYLSMERKWYAQESPKLLDELKKIFSF